MLALAKYELTMPALGGFRYGKSTHETGKEFENRVRRN